MKMKNSSLLINTLLVLFIITTLLAPMNAEAAPTKVKIQTPPVAASLPLLWIEETGQLEEVIDLDIKLSTDHQRALALINKNQIDMMVTGVNVGAKAYNKGMGLKLLNVNTWAIDYLLTNNFKADEWSDLKGKTLSLPLKGGPLDFLARYFLDKNDIDPKEDINIVYRPLANGSRYFMAGKVDSIILPEPMVTVNILKNKNANLSLDIQKEWGKYHDGEERIPFVGLFVSKEFANNYPQKAKMLNGLYMKGIDWVNNNPEEAAKLGAKHFKLPQKIIQKSFDRINLNYYGESKTEELVDMYFDDMIKFNAKLLGGKLPDEKFYY